VHNRSAQAEGAGLAPHHGVEEVIVATDPTVEGEATALYITRSGEAARRARHRIAQGLPMGGESGVRRSGDARPRSAGQA